MKTFLAFLFIVVTFTGCASVSQSLVIYSLPVTNETKETIDVVEIRSEKKESPFFSKTVNVSSGTKVLIFRWEESHQSLIARANNILPGEKVNFSFPLIEGWNYMIAYQGDKFSEKPFFVKNGEIVEFIGNKKQLNKVIFSPDDF